MKLKDSRLNHFSKTSLSFMVGFLILGGLFAYGSMRIVSLEEEVRSLNGELTLTNSVLVEKTEALQKDVSRANDLVLEIARALSASNQTVQGFQQAVGQISNTVETLEKLSKTDPELLQKYSKVYFLNEHYLPERLTVIDSEYLYSDRSPARIHSQVWPRLKELLDAAKADGVALYVKSAYRSFDEQKSLKSSYAVTYGVGTANQFSADQGYSEHQLGTTVDFITIGLGGQLSGFEKTQAYQWLLDSAFPYGFVLSYPSNNTSYVFEPWHWRYVGVALATALHNQSKYFYDLEQREIDEYLVNIFD